MATTVYTGLCSTASKGTKFDWFRKCWVQLVGNYKKGTQEKTQFTILPLISKKGQVVIDTKKEKV